MKRGANRRLVILWAAVLLVLIVAGVVQGIAVDRATEGLDDPSLIDAARESTTPTMTLVVAVTTFAVWSGSLYSFVTVRRLRVGVWRILVIAAAGATLTLAPSFGWLIALVALVAFVRWWIARGWLDTAVVVATTAVFEAAAAMPVYLGFALATTLLA